MAKDNSINETFMLPSKGMIYDVAVNPQVTLRSMTTMEEMKRQSQTDAPYKVMADIIEDCMIEKPKIHVYDMCLGDYEFLLYKLRVVTYGPDYKMAVTCPNCGKITEAEVNLDELDVFEYDDSVLNDMNITLPVSGKLIELKFQTPKDLDNISYKKREMQRKTKSSVDYSLLFATMSLIRKVDGQVIDPLAKEDFVKKLSMQDVNYIIKKAEKLNKKVGVDNLVIATCSECHYEIVTPFRPDPTFFRPDID